MVAIEPGGRWSDEAAALLWQLGCAKSREVLSNMTHGERHWTRMLALLAR